MNNEFVYAAELVERFDLPRIAPPSQNGVRSAKTRPYDGTRSLARDPAFRKPAGSFPSGHAVHVGALALAASVFRKDQRNMVWSVGANLVLTRIVPLAH